MILKASDKERQALEQKRLAKIYGKRIKKFAYLPTAMADGSVIWLSFFWRDCGVELYNGRYYQKRYFIDNYYNENGCI